ncbi:NUDIX domain-containing protein [Candidatus Parcubacteria bacterium]|nr:NUDIX domain-containing protein [Candidatus Parcubacteria bacterium]
MKQAAGGVIIGPEKKVVLVEQHGNSWSFPKGGVEEGETLLAAAQREIKEETGIEDAMLIDELGSYERKSIGKDGQGETDEWGSRKRTFFLFTTETTDLKAQDSEVTQIKWVTLDEAYELLTHPKDKEFLAENRATLEKCLKSL